MDIDGANTLHFLHSLATPDSLKAALTSTLNNASLRSYGEHVAESAGAAGDSYRFRYDNVSPEESYSPIAAMRPRAHSADMDMRQARAWLTHIDIDGAVCSEPIEVPLTLTVKAADGSSTKVQVHTLPQLFFLLFPMAVCISWPLLHRYVQNCLLWTLRAQRDPLPFNPGNEHTMACRSPMA